MSEPRTLLSLAGADLTPARLETATLLLIDYQNEYRDGPLALPGAEAAIDRAAGLLKAARAARAPVLHVAHRGAPGGLFDRAAPRGQIVDPLAPHGDEAVIEKPLPNAFAHTELAARLAETGRSELIVIGFMTHMCVSATARAALDHGLRVTIDGAACATRALPDPLSGGAGAIDAETVHRVALAELADRFAIIVDGLAAAS